MYKGPHASRNKAAMKGVSVRLHSAWQAWVQSCSTPACCARIVHVDPGAAHKFFGALCLLFSETVVCKRH